MMKVIGYVLGFTVMLLSLYNRHKGRHQESTYWLVWGAIIAAALGPIQ